MNGKIFEPIAARAAPVRSQGLVPWIKLNLFADTATSVATVVVGALLLWYLPQLLHWALLTAQWSPNAEACRADGAGRLPPARHPPACLRAAAPGRRGSRRATSYW